MKFGLGLGLIILLLNIFFIVVKLIFWFFEFFLECCVWFEKLLSNWVIKVVDLGMYMFIMMLECVY